MIDRIPDVITPPPPSIALAAEVNAARVHKKSKLKVQQSEKVNAGDGKIGDTDVRGACERVGHISKTCAICKQCGGKHPGTPYSALAPVMLAVAADELDLL